MKTKYLFLVLLAFPIVSPRFVNAQLKHTITQVAGKTVKAEMWQGREVQFAEKEIAVKIKPSATQVEINSLLSMVGAKIINSFDKLGWGLIELPAGKDEILTIEDLSKLPFVVAAEPNMVTRVDLEPNDPYFQGTNPATYPYQWALKNIGQTPPTGTNDADIDAPEAWNISTGSSDVIIAILDTGIPMQNGSLSHPDLDDPNKIIIGRDFIETLPSDTTVRDDAGHGTHVAGIAAAESNNGTGIAGVAWNCKIMVIQVFDGYGNGTWAAFYNGVKYAVDYQNNNPGKKVVINFSGGGGPSQQLLDAVIYAYNSGVPIVAAAGNDDYGTVSYPAAYSPFYSNVIAVSATDQNDVISSYSNIGSEITVAAPGGWGIIWDGNVGRFNTTGNLGKNIFSTTPNYPFNLQTDPSYPGDPYSTDVTQNYGYLAGTSMATPLVTGITGLLLSVNSNLTPAQISNILKQSADDKGSPGRDDYYGHGRVNAYQAIKYCLEFYGGTLTQNLTIPLGETWNFIRGRTVHFQNDVSLIVNGTLNAGGISGHPVTFTSASGTSPGSWGSIQLNGPGASGSNIRYANIQYGTEIDVINANNVTIQNCNITNSLQKALYFYGGTGHQILDNTISNSNIYHGIDIEGSASVDCNNNTITKNSPNTGRGVGILYGGGTSGTAAQNDISGWDWGIGAIWGASIDSWHYPSDSKNNRIRNCNYGLTVYRNGYGLLGLFPYWGNNSIYDNSKNVAVGITYPSYASTLQATYNWWGSDPPNTSLFSVGSNATFAYISYLTNDPWAGFAKIIRH